jgi:hypothetical protein
MDVIDREAPQAAVSARVDPEHVRAEFVTIEQEGSARGFQPPLLLPEGDHKVPEHLAVLRLLLSCPDQLSSLLGREPGPRL